MKVFILPMLAGGGGGVGRGEQFSKDDIKMSAYFSESIPRLHKRFQIRPQV